jgi:sugar-specific transcriptional regulator TrmB
VDVISRQSGLPAQKALAVLLGLEIKGIVKQIEGKQFYLQ